MTTDELIDDVIMYLNMGGALPDILPEKEIRRIISREAKPWFYQNYSWSLIKSYYYVPNSTLKKDEFTNYSYITLPCEIQNVTWLYQANDRSLFSLGVNAPNLSVNLGVTNQPYLSSYATTVGELGVYKVVIDGFADMLNQLNKETLKFDYNFASNRLHILTSTTQGGNSTIPANIIIECYVQIPEEDLYELDLFKRYVKAKAGMQLGRLLLRYDYQLPGGVKINSDAVLSEAKEDMDKILEEIKNTNPGGSWFWMVSR